MIANKLAKFEIGWWKAHHRKQWKKVLSEMSHLYALQFGISFSEAKQCVRFRLSAAKEHDLAEKYEDKGDMKRANLHWKNAEKWLVKHFAALRVK
jgi:hypothetical protein